MAWRVSLLRVDSGCTDVSKMAGDSALLADRIVAHASPFVAQGWKGVTPRPFLTGRSNYADRRLTASRPGWFSFDGATTPRVIRAARPE
jgi:hypothetical protein